MTKTTLCLIAFLLALSLTTVDNARGGSSPPKERLLPIPPLLDDKSKSLNEMEYEITVQKGATEFFTGTPNITYGYNGPLLGPTLRARRGNKVTIRVKNNLREYTTVHWHGMLLPGEMDGGPHQVIRPDSTWEVSFKVDQPAATLWYHPHGIGNTAIQVYGGLAGLFILDDEVSENLDLPKEYGKNDIPLIVQDRRFSPEGYLMYGNFMQDIMMGMMARMQGGSDIIHNFHAHGIQFQLLERNGKPPPPNELGWKDTFHLNDGERVKIIIRFHHPGLFMYHCHILEHEDNGMMGQFKVE